MKYTITHGSIAALINVVIDDTSTDLEYVLISVGEVIGTPSTERLVPFKELPEKVQDTIRHQFDAVFSLPLEKREEWIEFNRSYVKTIHAY